MRIKSITARQIINGKGHPTIQVEVETSKSIAFSSVPIAASKGKYEYFDSYDNKLKRYDRESLKNVIDNIERAVTPELLGRNTLDQEAIDKLLLEIDSTFDRSNIGIQPLTAISQAIAKLGAMESDLPLFKYLRVLYDFTGSAHIKLNSEYILPKPVVTICQAGLHNINHNIPAQEVLVIPKSSFSYRKDLIRLFQSLNTIHHKSHSEADYLESFLTQLSSQVSKADIKLSLGLDMAASRFERPGSLNYVIPNFNSSKVSFNNNYQKLLQVYSSLIQKNKLTYLEDFFAEDDYSAWKELMDLVSKEERDIEVVADDFTASNLERLEKVGMLECSNNVVIKPSQAGTVIETIHFAQRVRKLGQNISVSYRHGETEDTFISDLAVALNADFIRSGYYLGTEYNSKLNRLLQIEDSVR